MPHWKQEAQKMHPTILPVLKKPSPPSRAPGRMIQYPEGTEVVITGPNLLAAMATAMRFAGKVRRECTMVPVGRTRSVRDVSVEIVPNKETDHGM